MSTGKHGTDTYGGGNTARWPLSTKASFAACGVLLFASATYAAIDEETQFVLNTLSFLMWGALVMWMSAGFTMLESGSVRTKNASVICL